MLVKISREDYKKCEEASHNYWAKNKKNACKAFRDGSINTPDDPAKAERVGLLGEMAFSNKTGLPVDFRYKHGGNPYDFLLGEIQIDIKTAKCKCDHCCIVSHHPCRLSYKEKKKMGLKFGTKEWDRAYATDDGQILYDYVFNEELVYVGAYIVEDNRKTAEVELVGYELGTVIKGWRVYHSIKEDNDQLNFHLKFGRLKPLKDLLCKPNQQ